MKANAHVAALEEYQKKKQWKQVFQRLPKNRRELESVLASSFFAGYSYGERKLMAKGQGPKSKPTPT